MTLGQHLTYLRTGQGWSQDVLAEAAPRIAEFARREGLEAHARSVCARAQQNKEVQP